MNKEDSIKEKFKQALNSTIKVISDNFEPTNNLDKNKNLKKNELFEINNLDTISDFIKARAVSDSTALRKKFSNQEIYKKNLPSNTSCKSLYSIAEKNIIAEYYQRCFGEDLPESLINIQI